jgi:hypothetical protein
MTFAVGMSRQLFKQSRVPRNVAVVGVSGIEPAFRVFPRHRERDQGHHGTKVVLVTYARTYAEPRKQAPSSPDMPLTRCYAYRDIHKPTDTKGFRHPSAPFVRLRMPSHTSPDGMFPAIPLAQKRPIRPNVPMPECPDSRYADKPLRPKTALPKATYTIRDGPEYRNRP